MIGHVSDMAHCLERLIQLRRRLLECRLLSFDDIRWHAPAHLELQEDSFRAILKAPSEEITKNKFILTHSFHYFFKIFPFPCGQQYQTRLQALSLSMFWSLLCFHTNQLERSTIDRLFHLKCRWRSTCLVQSSATLPKSKSESEIFHAISEFFVAPFPGGSTRPPSAGMYQ